MAYYDGDTSDRKLEISQLLKSPIRNVWEAWTNPKHIQNWWGPRDVKVDIHKMDVKPDGDWLLDITIPDGKKFPNKSVFKEIVPNEKIVFEHFNPNYLAIITFKPIGDDTLMHWTMIIETKKLYDALVSTFKADQGLRDNGDKLSEYLEKIF